jgi:tetratricopeptide (TPR) repeat protein
MGTRYAWFLAAVFATSVGAADLPKTRGWIELSTPNFTVRSSAGAYQTRRIGLELERFRDAFGRMTKGFPLPPDPTSVYVFGNYKQFSPYALDEHGEVLSISGYFFQSPFRNYVVVDASAGLSVVYHEYVHAVLERSVPEVPAWLDEGLAEFYSSFRFDQDSKKVELGEPDFYHLAVLSENGLVSLQELFTSETQGHEQGVQADVFYAQSWLLVHYLFTDDTRRASLSRLLTLLRDGTDSDAAVAATLGTDLPALLAELENYSKAGGDGFSLAFQHPITARGFSSRKMTPGEVLYSLGDLLAWQEPWNADAARLHLQAALEHGAPTAAVHAALGTAAEARENIDEAARHYRAAAEDPGADAEILTRCGSFVFDRYLDSDYEGDGEDPLLLEARALFSRSIGMDPDSIEALAGLVETYVFGTVDQADEGLAAVERALALRPDRQDVFADGLCLRARAGQVAEAWSQTEAHLRPRGSDRAWVEQCISSHEIIRAWERAEAGDVQGASELLLELERHLTESEQRARVTTVRESLGADADE